MFTKFSRKAALLATTLTGIAFSGFSCFGPTTWSY